MTLMHVLQVDAKRDTDQHSLLLKNRNLSLPPSDTSEPSQPQLGTALTQQPFTPVKVLVLMLVLLMSTSILYSYFYTWCVPIALPVVPCTLLVA